MAAKKTTTKRAAKRPAPASAPLLGQRDPAHILTHTARIQRVLEANPTHRGRAQYEKALAEYRALWEQLDAPARDSARSTADGIHDMTADVVASAVATLEG